MAEINIPLAVWITAGSVMLAVLLAGPPWVHRLPKWAQIFVTIAGGPVTWACTAFFAFWVMRDERPVSPR